MPARFILSLDCEGKWGVADALTRHHQRRLTDDRLSEAYGAILHVLEEYDIQATFAFVGAFAQSPGDFARIRPDIDALARFAPAYLGPALRDIDSTSGSGWHGGHLVEAVRTSRVAHEIALHGVTHVPWTTVAAEFAEAEMRLFETLGGPVRQSRTFVYPRNLVAHTAVLARQGLLGFRLGRPRRSRALSFLSEFNVYEAPDQPRPNGEIIAIPAGFFLNWRSGLRSLVPPAVTQLRATRLLEAAAATGGIVHYWLHPENIATAPTTLALLRNLVREVARRRDAGDCEVLTQLGYCERVGSSR
jgi:peptidoglycan/xylan/chitin deacetylase (PgdA/CDA1 family)